MSFNKGLETHGKTAADIFWNIGRTLTYNVLFYFILGIRGGGKSYGAKKRMISNFIKRKEQFAYVRRFKDDLKKTMPTFFQDVGVEFPEYQFKVDGEKFYVRRKPVEEDEPWTDEDIAGYGFALSTANNLKSMSFPLISMIVFDEFLLEEGYQKYLPDEVGKFLNLYETIARPGTGHIRCTAWFLANTITITNPYFLYFGLRMPKEKDKNDKWIWKHPTKPIIVENVDGEAFKELKSQSEFGQLVKDTEYGGYSLNNEFLLDDDKFVERRSKKAKHFFNFIYKDKTYGVWFDYTEGKMWVSEAIDPDGYIYSFTLKDHAPNIMLFKSKSRHLHIKQFVECVKNGIVYYENMNIKNICFNEIYKMIMS